LGVVGRVLVPAHRLLFSALSPTHAPHSPTSNSKPLPVKSVRLGYEGVISLSLLQRATGVNLFKMICKDILVLIF
jgi:uncharacterized membrane-anchored protein